jgi:hypothetical protein
MEISGMDGDFRLGSISSRGFGRTNFGQIGDGTSGISGVFEGSDGRLFEYGSTSFDETKGSSISIAF